ncbi:unnamed protein product [Mytilus coruscus]|uniref:Uncharacterized protein n=1 Tax=Mytilus coruscus TaxID=42192 RepID=A0A6J8A2L2_MYTCO|nr:unnamed protein product [Mytilus coruscus]
MILISFSTFKFRKAKDSTCAKPPASNISVITKEIKNSNIRTEESVTDDSNIKLVHDASDDEKCDLISKFVLKKSRFTIGKLICKIENTGRQINFDIDQNTYEELVRSDRYYKKFNTVLTQDFSDVRETQYMTAEIEQAILQMIDYAKNKKLL